MPELPDLSDYLAALEPRVLGQKLLGIRRKGPSLLRTALPPLDSAYGREVVGLRRVGKRLCFGLDGGLWLVLHLMIAGRLHWQEPAAPLTNKIAQAAFDFPNGTLVLTEAGSKKRAGLWLVEGEAALAALDPGGVEPLEIDAATFAAVLRRENHTLKRALTDPRLLAGIGNAYSDEILHAAGLSPLAMTAKLSDEEMARLHDAAVRTLREWIEKLRAATGDGFPTKVTAFRPGMAVHGRYGKPCPACGTAVQRIRHADNETNYCPRCQTGGRLLADRSLSRLLRSGWPRTIEELELARRPATPTSGGR